MLRDVAPLLTSNDVADLFFCQTKLRGKAAAAVSAFVQVANALDLERGQFVIATVPALVRCVAVVICERAKEQVRRIYARWVITAVAHAHAWRNRAVGVLKRNTMSDPSLVVLRSWAGKTSEASVAARNAAANPLPAVIWAALVDLLPETFTLVGASWHRSILPLRYS